MSAVGVVPGTTELAEPAGTREGVHRTGSFTLESGAVLRDVTQAYTLTGELDPSAPNLVVVFHSLTGDQYAARWWGSLVGAGRALDTGRWAVLCPNLLGSCYGTTPVPEGVMVTPRDMARLAHRLVTEGLGVEQVALATGGSLGGMVALEWAAGWPALSEAVVVFAAPAAHTAQAIAFGHVQRQAMALGGARGLALARQAAMLTYRTGEELEARFGRRRATDGRFQVQSYLDHKGEELVGRFQARSYRALLDAMDAHDVGRGRGGVGPALGAFQGRLVGVGIPGDLLYTAADVRRWTDEAGAAYREIHSLRGHDAFLLETSQVAAILGEVTGP